MPSNRQYLPIINMIHTTILESTQQKGKNLQEIFQHFLQKLRETPLLLGWLLIGPFLTLWTNGWLGFAFGWINICLIAAYAVFIYCMTPNPSPPTALKRPWLEFALALTLFGAFLFIQLLDFGVWKFQPWYGWVHASLQILLVVSEEWILFLNGHGAICIRLFRARSSN